jgi:hypothetical protein
MDSVEVKYVPEPEGQKPHWCLWKAVEVSTGQLPTPKNSNFNYTFIIITNPIIY